MNEDPDRPQPSTSLRNDEIVYLLDIPYGSDDECDEVIDEDNITDDQIFARLDEILDDRNDELQQQRSIGGIGSPIFHLLIKKKEEKSQEELQWSFTTNVNDTKLSMVSWRDNDSVMLGSTLCGVVPMESIKRYDRKVKKYIDVPCPQIVKVYNKHMGGVDLMDSHIGRHHIRLRSRKWYFRMFYHMVDMAVVNAWILHSTLSETRGMTQKEFRN
ncbi:piggyBac transposable element-derived protein 3-like [Homalodisca vitripennis]|uniref:piggyBac transposable element-derived protein 3-like n=1 Tax=Homalodisca vitripennis TaxID=197043 RepID=UPI001EE9F59E|nr:piggyBac transposable element-derived protein 3-like [Homalodisca vitripennis]